MAARADVIQIELPAVALIRGGGIVEAIAEDDFAGGKRGPDDFADELRAAGVHQEQLGFGGQTAVGIAVLEEMTDFLAGRCAAGFAQQAHGASGSAEAFGEALNLGGFSPALGAFKRDEQSAHAGGVRGAAVICREWRALPGR